MRMFAGPNGSGKSTLKKVLREELLGAYLNPDEVENTIREKGYLDLRVWQIDATQNELESFQSSSGLYKRTGLLEQSLFITPEGQLDVKAGYGTGYLAAFIVEFLRHNLLIAKRSFTFETVMSDASKVEFLRKARENTFRTYLYYIATEDPLINIDRVKKRVALGGHSVPEDKTEDRYYRSLHLLPDAIRNTDRAYIFDNSSEGKDHTWIAEITDGKILEIKSDVIPAWFKKFVLDKMQS